MLINPLKLIKVIRTLELVLTKKRFYEIMKLIVDSKLIKGKRYV